MHRARRQKVSVRKSLFHSSSTKTHLIVVLIGVLDRSFFIKRVCVIGAVTIGRVLEVFVSIWNGRSALSLLAGGRGRSPRFDGAHGPVVHERVARIEDARCAELCLGRKVIYTYYQNTCLAVDRTSICPSLPCQRLLHSSQAVLLRFIMRTQGMCHLGKVSWFRELPN